MQSAKKHTYTLLVDWILLIFFIGSFIIVLVLSNTGNPLSSEKDIKKRELVSTYSYKGYDVSEYVLKVFKDTTLPETRNYEYYYAFKVNTKKEIGEGYIIFNTLRSIRTLMRFYKPIIDTKVQYLNRRFIIFAQQPDKINHLFDETVGENIESLDKGKIIRNKHLRFMVIKNNSIELRVFLVLTDSNLIQDEIVSSYIIDNENKELIYDTLIRMAENAESNS